MPGMTDLRIKNPADPRHTNPVISTNGRYAQRVWEQKFVLEDSVQSMLVARCIASNKELCGFISTDQEIWYIDNVHLEPTHNYYMDQKQIESVLTEIYDIRQVKVAGVFHTHPNNVPWPTPRDLVGWPNPALRWHYWIVTNEEVIEWELSHEPPTTGGF